LAVAWGANQVYAILNMMFGECSEDAYAGFSLIRGLLGAIFYFVGPWLKVSARTLSEQERKRRQESLQD